jgi:hypothetical protein
MDRIIFNFGWNRGLKLNKERIKFKFPTIYSEENDTIIFPSFENIGDKKLRNEGSLNSKLT